jgi:hypothetical protein
MDIDSQDENVNMNLLLKKSSKLDAIKDFDKKLLMKTAEREKQDKDERIQKKFKVCATLPDDWSLKTEIEITMPLLKPVEDVSEILNYKDIAHALRYYIYMETQLPKFLQENQSKSIRVFLRL